MDQSMTSTTFFTSRPIPCGGSYTLTTLFGDMLSDAERLFGKGEMDWTPIGVEFFDCANPHIWFPGNHKNVCIRLTLSALNDYNEALWQLSQEIVHILAPVQRATNLEEGVATYFALNSPRHEPSCIKICRDKIQTGGYSQPLKDVEEIQAKDPTFVRRLRCKEPYLSRVTAGQILSVAPACKPEVAQRLTLPFVETT
jgi:hypothetical protein